MNDAKVEVWMRMYEEQVRHARHHETLRTQSTNVVIIISAAILAYVSSATISPSQNIAFGSFLILINLYGCVLSLKHYERNQLHLEVSRHYREVISGLSAVEGTRLNDARRAGRDKHRGKRNLMRRLRVHCLWSVLHILIALIGGAVVVHEIA